MVTPPQRQPHNYLSMLLLHKHKACATFVMPLLKRPHFCKVPDNLDNLIKQSLDVREEAVEDDAGTISDTMFLPNDDLDMSVIEQSVEENRANANVKSNPKKPTANEGPKKITLHHCSSCDAYWSQEHKDDLCGCNSNHLVRINLPLLEGIQAWLNKRVLFHCQLRDAYWDLEHGAEKCSCQISNVQCICFCR